MLQQSDPETAARLLKLAQEDVQTRWHDYHTLATATLTEER
jgi:hypothetical protein